MDRFSLRVDTTTMKFYRNCAPEVAEAYAATPSPVVPLLVEAFGGARRVLEVGCGSGRDLQALLDAGMDARGVDACPELIAEAKVRYPALSDRIHEDCLPDLQTIPDGTFDGILCWAVLMHLPQEELFDTVFSLRRVLRPGGRLLISTPVEGPAVDPRSLRDDKGRLFNGIPPEQFQFLLERVGFRRLHRWDSGDSLGRTGRSWSSQAFVFDGPGSRSLETIEGILNRDKKDATYKPALIRALAELASRGHSSARWLPGGRVAVPLDLITEKWIEYYWPLLESSGFIPQKWGEQPVCAKPMAFRGALSVLVNHYRNRGGLAGFTVDSRSRGLTAEASQLHDEVFRKVRSTIRAGPIQYAGGGGSNTFRCDGNTVEMAADLWREMSLMGSWIVDATILRWAELTSEISQGAIRPSEVIEALLISSPSEREVSAARSFYDEASTKECVWTGKPLSSAFELDHVIPFSLWRNNDLWNLLPASRTANQSKRDQLPSRALLRSRRSCITHYWSGIREVHRARFQFEAERLAGKSVLHDGSWDKVLFGAFEEAIETTALQRGVERWEPEGFQTWVSVGLTDSIGPAGPEAPVLSFSPSPPPEERFERWVPFYELEAAAGAFGPEQGIPDSGMAEKWVRVTGSPLSKDMFALRIVGRSMEPKIPDGSIGLFRAGEALAGSRQNRIVLVSLRDGADPETAGRLTVKRYWSQKIAEDDGPFHHVRIELRPLNPDFKAIVIEKSDEDAFRVVGEWVRCLG